MLFRVALLAFALTAAPNLVGRTAPTVPLKAIDNKDMTLAAARGRYVLLVFSDAKSRLLSRHFLAQNAARLGSARDLAVYNIMVPGQLLIPRAAWLYQARADAQKTVAEARESVMSFQQAGFDGLTIRFHADFDRRFSDLFDAPKGVVSLVLIDPNGYILAQEQNAEEPAVHRIMTAIKARKLAPGSHAQPVPGAASDDARAAAAGRLGVKTPRPFKRDPDDEDEEDAPPAAEEPKAEGNDDEAAAAPAGAPKGASKKKNRFLY